MGSCAAPSAKGDDKFITTDYLQQCPQDELDVLELLYWRFGFESDEIVEQMQKKNSVMII